MKTLFMRVGLLFVLTAMLGLNLGFAQTKFTINGTIKDAKNGETLIGVTVLIQELQTGNVSNEYGFYSLTLPAGAYTLKYSYIGYGTQEQKIELKSNQVIDIQLKEDNQTMQEVIVEAKKEDADLNVKSLEMGVSRLDIGQIRKTPALLGEADLIRALQMTPGVSTVGEGATGFNVRGGSIDQNLILMDEAPVYNSAHLFGLFSVFNPDAVKDVKLVKGGIPAQYGGRLSSVLDIRMKEGNNQRFSGSAGIGTVSSRLTLEAPIVKDQGSFVIAARRSYADLFLKLSSDPSLRNNTAYFYDLSAKANYKFSQKDRVFISGYFGRDVFKFDDDFQSDWGNATATLRWNHLFSQKLFANFTAIYSNYNYSLGIPSGTQAFDWDSKIINYNLKGDLNWYLTPHNTLNFGASALWYQMQPGKSRPTSPESIFNVIDLQEQNAVEYAAYLDHEWKISSRLSLQYGLRLSMYQLLGEGTYYDYEGELEKRKTAVNPRTYAKGETVAQYFNPEPRLSVRYEVSPTASLKASYNRMAQYLHLISNTTAASPTDVWTPSTQNIKPEIADQVALGYFQNFKNNTFEASIEAYYKTMSNQIDYVNGANLLLNPKLEGELLYGIGRSYGLELYIKKNTGKLNGWVSYTLSKSERKIDGTNNNQWYNAKYDRTHILNVVAIYDPTPRWSLSANFAYATGVATTFPNAAYEYDGIIVPHNTDNARNNYRVPAYHRLDFSATLNGKKRPNRRIETNWVFSIYNVYARRNPFTVFFRQNPDNLQQTQAVRFSVFGSILPSVTFNAKF
ncbi:MAG: TonB-dependent receptor [Microscillaceae bacterium]|jgi:hypothetical protein|nr:TonB-dependent receptor [Microscillaceae bacterium]